MRWLRRIAIAVIALYALWATAFFFLQKPFFFPAYLAREKGPGQKRPEGVQLWQLGKPQAMVDAWYAPPAEKPVLGGRSPLPKGTAVIFAHGNGEQIEHQVSLLSLHQKSGVHLLLVEFRGYGQSGGEPSEASIVSDFTQAYDRLIEQPGVDPKHIFFQGRSMGAAVVAALAARRPPAGVILESGFTSLKGFFPQLGLPTFLARDPFDSLKYLRAYRGPALVIHGLHDTLIPHSHGQALAQALGTELISFDAGHNDIPHGQQYWKLIFEFMGSEVKSF